MHVHMILKGCGMHACASISATPIFFLLLFFAFRVPSMNILLLLLFSFNLHNITLQTALSSQGLYAKLIFFPFFYKQYPLSLC